MKLFDKTAPVQITLSHSKQKHFKKIALLGCKAKIKLLGGKLDEGYTLLKKTAHNLRDFALELGQHIAQPFASRWTLEHFTAFEKQYSRKLGLPRKLLLGGMLVGMSALPALGQTYDVDTTGDNIDDNIGDGICETAGGDCSLRAAIQEANADGVNSIINIPTVLGQITLGSNLPNITNDGTLTINGTGVGNAVIDGDDTYRPITSIVGGDLTLSNITIQNGRAGNGGGIANSDNSTLSLHSSSIMGNTATSYGGGIYNQNNSTVSLHSSSIAGNSATLGGGIANRDNSTLSLHFSSIMGNTATSYGGGIYNQNNSTVSLHSSSIAGNSATLGGGIANRDNSTLSLHFSSIMGNTATSYGGGIQNFNSTLTIYSSSIAGNMAVDGGGIENVLAGTVTLHSSSITGNTATRYGGGIDNWIDCTLIIHSSSIARNTAVNGGGIFSYAAQLISSTSSITGNTATTGSGGGIYQRGEVQDASATLTNTTISSNTAPAGNGGGIFLNQINASSTSTLNLTHVTLASGTAAGGTGGLYINQTNGPVDVNLVNSILADNGTFDLTTSGTINITTAGRVNLIENSGVTGVSAFPAGTDPMLDPLTNDIHPLQASSPVIDQATGALTFDQRGLFRDANPDLGAYEFGAVCIRLTPPTGTTNTWTGCISSDWQDAGNWSNGIPVAGDNIYIPAGTDNNLIINEIATCSKFVQQIGAVVKVDYNAGGQLRVQF